jgi:diguanylate cyclase (GGDEF)-like protein
MRFGAALLAAGCALAPAAQATGPGAWPHGWALEGNKVFLHLPTLDTAGVRSIAQDRQGFLWLGSDSGLLRWDGYRLHSYAQDPGTPGALADNYVRVVYIDERERLWVGTNAGGLNRYDAEQDAFVGLPIGAGGTRDGNVAALTSDGQGGLWVGTGRGLDHLDGSSGRVDPPSERLPSAQVNALLLDRQGTLWVGTRGGLLRRPAGAARFEAAPWPAPGGAPAVTALAQDLAGRIWVGTALHGAFVFETGAALPRPVLETEGGVHALGDTITTVREVGSGEVWLGTDNSGLLRVDTTTWRTRRELHDDTRPSSLADNGIHTLFMDRSGLVWVASSVALSRIDPQQRMIQSFFGGSGAGRLLSDANISTLLALPDGRIWVGLGDGGIDLLDPAQGRIGRLRPGRGQPEDALPKSKVEAMARAPDGSVFLGTAAGLFRASADGSQVHRVTLPGHKDLLEVHCLRFADRRLWLGATDGLWELQLEADGTLRPLQHFDKELGDARIASMAPGRDGALWIGTQTGLARIDLASGKVVRLPVDPRDKSALPGGFVSSLLTDRDGRLWVATYGQGIQIEQKPRADGRPVFLRLSQRDGLPQNSVDSLQLDARGNVWVSTDDGLARIDPATLRIRVYRAAQGVGVGAFWAGAGTTTPPGDLLFGGLTGMVVVHPELEVPEQPVAPMALTEIHAGGQAVALAQALAGGGLTLGAHDRSLEVEFAALDYADPEHRRYAYQLQDFDTDWMETPATRRLAVYTNLPPGDYRLLLRSARANGPWSEALAVPVQVQAAWYQHDLVRLLGSLLVAVSIIGLVQLRTVVLRRRQRELERLVAERTAALQHSQQQLEQMAYFDMLTGLPNRRMFNEQLRRLLAGQQRGQGGFALLLIDLDGFKQVNDTLGHAVGDALLVAIAAQLRQLVRETDLAARLGGDEFAVLLANSTDISAIESSCARIVTKIGEPMVVAGHSVRVGASIGIVPCPARGASADELFRAADSALYQAKQAGRSTWRWGTAEAYSFTFG